VKAPLEKLVDLVKVEETSSLCTIHRPVQLAFGLGRSYVDQRPRQCGHRNAPHPPAIPIAYGHDSVDSNPLAPAFAGNEHVDFSWARSEQSP
jgi:hypothetical protein